ncbi:peptide ABC transporter substrate-binding protein [Candidatus Uhrbacteria bacterium]|nr:peptide ABC transporter substrate-binding protein [Candidatus Uhrbacteria bacterium]
MMRVFSTFRQAVLVGGSRLRAAAERLFGRRPQDLMKRQVLRVAMDRRFPRWRQWKQLPRVLAPWESRLLQSALLASVLSCLALVGGYVLTHREAVPAVGGSYTEGVIGTPQFLNPLYASSSDVDSDLVRLVYTGLFRWDPVQGVVPDLAESFAVSEDQKTYTVTLREGARWHDGMPVTAADALFTLQSIQNPAYRSPLVVSFRGVEVTQADERTLQFVLQEPFAPFLSTLTVGILPAHVWQDVPAKNILLTSRNLEPVGSGPYRFDKFTVDKKGNIRSYVLARNADFYRDPPMIEHLTFKFYSDAQTLFGALANRQVEGVSFVPSYLVGELKKQHAVRLLHPDMPLTVALFFNQDRQPLLKDIRVRNAFALSLDKQALVDGALGGKGRTVDAPILPGSVGAHPDVAKIAYDSVAANALLDETDFKREEGTVIRSKTRVEKKDGQDVAIRDELVLSLTTIDQDAFIRAAELLAEQVATAGIRLDVQVVSADALYEEVVKPRSYDILLTGTQLGLDPDPYPFWHSSQIRDPGLNLALYANREVDTLLEEARALADPVARAEKYRAFQDKLAEDVPAVFLYQAKYAYAVPTKLHNVSVERIYIPADRFATISSWYVKMNYVMK